LLQGPAAILGNQIQHYRIGTMLTEEFQQAGVADIGVVAFSVGARHVEIFPRFK
jgi:hypothetical protein